MKTLELTRMIGTHLASIGEVRVIDDDDRTELFKCYTMELPWKNNREGVSCIPVGNYLMRWTVSPRFTRAAQLKNPAAPNVCTYEVIDVPKRTGIRMHAANMAIQLKGCIAPGLQLADINKDGTLDVTSSVEALDRLHSILNKEPTALRIKWLVP